MGVSNGLPKNPGAMRGTKKCGFWWIFEGHFVAPVGHSMLQPQGQNP